MSSEAIIKVKLDINNTQYKYILNNLEINNKYGDIIFLNRNSNKPYLYIPYECVPDGEYAKAYIEDYIQSLPFNVNYEIKILEHHKRAKSIYNYILEELKNDTTDEYDNVIQKSYVFDINERPEEFYNKAIYELEKIFNLTSRPEIYNYDIKQIYEGKWKISIWILNCDCDDKETAEKYIRNLDEHIPSDWKKSIDYQV